MIDTQVLLIDDDEDEALLIREMLESADRQRYRVDWVSGAEAGLDDMRGNRHDCYLLDYRLGPAEGTQVLSDARRQGCQRPVIVLTGYGSPDLDARFQAMGADDYLVKGRFDRDTLDRSIRYARSQWDIRQRLMNSEQRYRALIEMSPDAIVVHSDGRLLFVNGTARRLLGVGERPVEELDLEALGLRLEDCREVDHARDAPPIIHLPERELEFECAATRIPFDDRQATMVLLHDVTERKRLERRLLRQECLSAIGALSAGIAHEYDKLLMRIDTDLEGLGRQLRQLGGDDKRANQARKAAGQAQKLTRDVLQLSSPKPVFQVVDLRTVVEGALQLCRMDLQADGVTIQRQLADDCFAEVDRGQLEQALVNLIINARQAMTGSERRHLVLRLQAVEQEVRIGVEDSGVGIPEEIQSRIFTPFFSTRALHCPPGDFDPMMGGTGLGLSMTETVVRRHGGRVAVTSSRAGSTVFTITLPRSSRQPDERGEDPTPSAVPIMPLPALRVLVLEDEPALLELLLSTLEGAGMETYPATDGRAARRLLSERAFDVVVADLHAPDSSRDFLRTVGSVRRQGPLCLAMSARTELLETVDEQTGTTVSKPFAVGDLPKQIRQQLRSRSARLLAEDDRD